jgi:N-acyl-D-amino-acid deacylase
MTGATALIIKNADVLDGLGSPPRRADVLVADERVVAVRDPESGDAGPDGARVVDGTGRMVCPGFIDVHTHDDSAVMADPDMACKTTQGVTTVVTGNCGIGLAPHSPALAAMLAGELRAILGYAASAEFDTFGDYLDGLAAVPCALNRVGLVPHGALRMAAMAEPAGPADDAEVDRMCELLAASLEAGGVGLSTGLVYHPGRGSTSAELARLCEVLAAHDGIYSSHMRDEGAGLLTSIDELVGLGRETGCRVHISHLKAIGVEGMPRMEKALRAIEDAADSGVSITADAYPYTSGSTALAPALLVARSSATVPRALRVVSAPDFTELEGRALLDIADEWGISEDEAVERIEARDGSVTAVIEMMQPDTVRAAISSPHSMIGSDGLPSPRGRTHPRLYGTYPRVLHRYVRPGGPLELADAVRRMTSLPAQRFGATDRGVIAPGNFADLVVFDPARVRDRATPEQPDLISEGIDLVVVNGEVVVDHATPTGARPGQVVRA